MEDEIKCLDIQEFRQKGFLQEVNRNFFHPLGLALEVIVHDDGREELGRIWDYRDDPEGMLFGKGMINQNKVKEIENLRLSKTEKRKVISGVNSDGIQYE